MSHIQHVQIGAKLRSTCSVCKTTKRNAIDPEGDFPALHRIVKSFDAKHAHPEHEPSEEGEGEIVVAEASIDPPPSPPVAAKIDVPTPPPTQGRGTRIRPGGSPADVALVTGGHANPTRISSGGAARVAPPAPSAVTAGATRSGTTRIGSR